MPWRSVTCRLSASALVVVALSNAAQALDRERLWLPKSFQKYYLNLVGAAEAAESLPRCQSVLEGTIDREQSRPQHPLFRILCLQENGLTYNEMVDGLSLQTLTTRYERPRELTEQEREQQRLLELERLAAAIEQRKAEVWGQCWAEFEQKTHLMLHMVVITQQQPEPLAFSDQEVKFAIDFDAKDMIGTPLQYRALCASEPDKPLQLQLMKR